VEFSFEELEKDFKLAFLDLCRVAVADWWGSIIAGNGGNTGNTGSNNNLLRKTLNERETLPSLRKRTMFNACNKSEWVVKWQIERMACYLEELFPEEVTVKLR